jgi:hypothetical protein
LYTDGLTEARRGGVQFGEGRLLDRLRHAAQRPAQHIVDELLAAAEDYAAPLTDDVEVLAVRWLGEGAPDGRMERGQSARVLPAADERRASVPLVVRDRG